MTKNLYDLIGEAIDEEGHLIKEPELPEIKVGELAFAPGAKDGIFLYHNGMVDAQKELHLEYAIAAIEEANNGNEAQALDYARKLAESGSVLQIADEIHQYIAAHFEEMDRPKIFTFAYRLILSATLPEQMKFGLNIMELFHTDKQEPLRDLVIHCAYSDEMTLAALFNLSHWPDATSVMFRLMQEVHGWGRIHLVRMIRCEERPDIQHWLLLHGIENYVHPGYSAMDVYRKTDFDHVLADHPEDELYTAMLKVIEAILAEGPMQVTDPELIPHLVEILCASMEERNPSEEQEQILDSIEENLIDLKMEEEAAKIRVLHTRSLS